MIRRQAEEKIKNLATNFKAVIIMGPRQSGKTTLSQMCFPEKKYVTLENPANRSFAIDDPEAFLDQHQDGAIFDEIQRTPELLSYLQERLDKDDRKGRFILTGSNNLLLLEKITQTLAGRAAYVQLLPFAVSELSSDDLLDNDEILWKGGYPPIQADNIHPEDWFSGYVRTYIERDVRQIRNVENLLIFERFLSLCAGRVGQLLNYSNLAIEVGVDAKTIQSWMGVLQASYIIHLLPPFYKNFNKRILKSPKLYFYDTGLVSYLLRITDPKLLAQHPFRGALFENFIVSELIKNRYNQGKRSNLYYWRDNSGNEIDVIIDKDNMLLPVEIKSGKTITQDYFKGLKFWQKLTKNQGGLILYGGNVAQKRSFGIAVHSWRTVYKF
jgi:predicted AAA+ superfamily ATPase